MPLPLHQIWLDIRDSVPRYPRPRPGGLNLQVPNRRLGSLSAQHANLSRDFVVPVCNPRQLFSGPPTSHVPAFQRSPKRIIENDHSPNLILSFQESGMTAKHLRSITPCQVTVGLDGQYETYLKGLCAPGTLRRMEKESGPPMRRRTSGSTSHTAGPPLFPRDGFHVCHSHLMRRLG